MLAIKAFAASVEIAASWVLASATDSLATRVALYAAAGAGFAWIWKNMLRPIAKVLHRMAKAVEALEDLPGWRRQTNRRIELTNRRMKLLELGVGHLASGQRALLRELGVEDRVRRQFSDPDALEQLLADFGDDDVAADPDS